MEANEIKKLLERYWNCETTLEEEKLIREFFSSNGSLPNEEKSKAFFIWQNSQTDIKMDSEQRIIDTVLKDNSSKTKQLPLPLRSTNYFYSFLKVAASILIVLSTGIGVYTHYTEEKQIEQTYSETYSDPDIAMKEAQAALNKVSSSLTKGEQIIKDNLADTDTTKNIIK